MVHCDELVPDQDLAGEYARFLDSEDSRILASLREFEYFLNIYMHYTQ